MDKKLLVVGELNMDIILNDIEGFPEIGREIIAEQLNVTLGSSSAIFASNISTLGIPVFFSGMVGDDVFGVMVLDALKKRNVDTSLVRLSKEYKTGITVVMSYSEDRANVTYPGAMDIFSYDDIPADLTAYHHLHLSSFFLQRGLKSGVTDLFRKAKKSGLSTSLDLQWDPANEWLFPYEDCLPYVDIFLPNEKEILLLSDESSVDQAIKKMAAFGNSIVVKRGTNGYLACHKGEMYTAPAFLHNSFVDAIGAGDSFNAGFIARYLKGAAFADCLQFANLCGALNTTAAGGTGAFSSVATLRLKAKEIFNTDVVI